MNAASREREINARNHHADRIQGESLVGLLPDLQRGCCEVSRRAASLCTVSRQLLSDLHDQWGAFIAVCRRSRRVPLGPAGSRSSSRGLRQ